MKNLKQAIYLVVLIGTLGACNAPKAVFLVHQEEDQAPSKVEFINRSEKAESYEWDFGDGNYSVEAEPEHRYRQSGTYEVKLNAIQGKKSRSMEQVVEVKPPSTTTVELVTEFGSMMIELFDETPLHRDNFVKLVEEGFYDSLLFHRVIPAFMVQGGDPDSRNATAGRRLGSGSPGYQIPAEFSDQFIHRKGALAAARTGGPGNPEKKSSGSQFYIVHGSTVDEAQLELMGKRGGRSYSEEQIAIYTEEGGYPPLDGEYTVFGQVVDGLDVIDKITAQETDPYDRPKEDVLMKMYLIR